ncbi:hypothetical protein J2Z81_000634 [Virgibacillus campisalis]|uniref:Uncharacterized protein n=1 Tax=Virgibacillus alimentarius TaxID=698769 RepID=A0ABS4S5C9_9BACI|nr:hypothetical protein [Virgibacillus alimentarius]
MKSMEIPTLAKKYAKIAFLIMQYVTIEKKGKEVSIRGLEYVVYNARET